MASRYTIQDELNWYMQQADNPENPPEARDMWRQLAKELGNFLGVDLHFDDTPLF